MTSFLVESILLIALIGTIAGLLVFRRELRELKSNQATYANSLDETGDHIQAWRRFRQQ